MKNKGLHNQGWEKSIHRVTNCERSIWEDLQKGKKCNVNISFQRNRKITGNLLKRISKQHQTREAAKPGIAQHAWRQHYNIFWKKAKIFKKSTGTTQRNLSAQHGSAQHLEATTTIDTRAVGERSVAAKHVPHQLWGKTWTSGETMLLQNSINTRNW